MGIWKIIWSNSTGRFSDLLCKTWCSFSHTPWPKYFLPTISTAAEGVLLSFVQTTPNGSQVTLSAQVPASATLALSAHHMNCLLSWRSSSEGKGSVHSAAWTRTEHLQASWRKKECQNPHGNSRMFFSTNFWLLQGDLISIYIFDIGGRSRQLSLFWD